MIAEASAPVPSRLSIVPSRVNGSVLQDCSSEVHCSSCKERFNQIGKLPRLLPCFHTVCEGCLHLEGILAHACPICKEKYSLGTDGISSLKVNYYVTKMVQIFNLLESEQTERLKCMGCNRAAHFRCMKCSENYCSSHAEFHHKSRATHDHNIIAVKDVANNIHSLSAVREQEYCAVHTTRSLELYCLECDKALCSLCCITQHRTHSTCSVANAAQRAKRELLSLGPKAGEKMSVEKQKVIALKKMANEVQIDHETAKRTLKEFSQRMIQNIKTREDELLSHLSAKRAALNKTINGKIEQTEDKLKMVKQTKEFAEKIQKNWSEVEILNVRKQIVDRLQEFSDSRTESVDNIYINPIRFAPSGEDALIQGIWSFKNRHLLKV